jgi:putative transposase
MSQASQCTLQVLDRCWKSFFVSIKDWKKNPHKYLGMPNLPNYKKKDGRFTWFLKNNQTYIKEGRLYFRLKVFNGYSFKTNCPGRLISVRFVPKGSIYVMEIVYEQEINDIPKLNKDNIASIDLGVNNLVTMVNNIGQRPIIINGRGIKSLNQFYNKQRSKILSEIRNVNHAAWSMSLNKLDLKRCNRMKNYLHHISKFIVSYCANNNIGTLVIGLNSFWKNKTKLNHIVAQQFEFIPYGMLIKQLKYKCQLQGIELIITDESYTSGTSFLDNEEPIKENYNKARRVHRGLFISNKGIKINSDVNGAFQIMRKVFPNMSINGIEGNLTPIVLNVV